MKLIITYLLATTALIANAQISGSYIAKNFNNKIDYRIIFLRNGCYYIELPEQITHDIILSLVTSYGSYTFNNKEIFLNDEAHGFKMQLLLFENKTLKVKKGFVFLENRYLGFYSNNHETDCMNSKISPSKQQEEREKYNQSHEAVFPLRKGIYRSEGYGDALNCYRLNIREENGYSLHYKDILLSEGKWQRDKNVLELCDVHLQHSFYLLIDEKGLISKYLPGEYQSCALLYSQSP
jgi:hypothetical protein